MGKRFPAAHLVRHFVEVARNEEEGIPDLQYDTQTIDYVRGAWSVGCHRSASLRLGNVTDQTSIAARVFLTPDMMELIGPHCDPSTMMCLALTCKQFFQQLAYEPADIFHAAAFLTLESRFTTRVRLDFVERRELWKFLKATRRDLHWNLINAEFGGSPLGYLTSSLGAGTDFLFCIACSALHPKCLFSPGQVSKHPWERTCMVSWASISTCAHDSVSYLDLHKIISDISSREYQGPASRGPFRREPREPWHTIDFQCKHRQHSAGDDKFEGVKTHLTGSEGSGWKLCHSALLPIDRKEIFKGESSWALHNKLIPRGPFHEQIDDIGKTMLCKHQMPFSSLVVDDVIRRVDLHYSEDGTKLSEVVCSVCKSKWTLRIFSKEHQRICLLIDSQKSLGSLRSPWNWNVLRHIGQDESLQGICDVEDGITHPAHLLKSSPLISLQKQHTCPDIVAQHTTIAGPSANLSRSHERHPPRKSLNHVKETRKKGNQHTFWKYLDVFV